MTDARCILDGQFDLAESPVWSVALQRLWFVDINRPALHRFDPVTGKDESWPMPESIGCVAQTAAGGVIGALRSGLYRLDLAGGQHRKIAGAPYDPAGPRFKDGRCDRPCSFSAGRTFAPPTNTTP